MLRMLSTVQNIKKVTFGGMEERENSVPLLVQKGTLDEISGYLDKYPNRTYPH